MPGILSAGIRRLNGMTDKIHRTQYSNCLLSRDFNAPCEKQGGVWFQPRGLEDIYFNKNYALENRRFRDEIH